MGVTYIRAAVAGPKGKPRTLKLLVDSGATYTVLPEKDWTRLGLTPDRSIEILLADGTTMNRSVSECLLRLDGEKHHTPVILGEEFDEAVLGAVTLEEFGLVLNPLERTLRPARIRLASPRAVGQVRRRNGRRR